MSVKWKCLLYETTGNSKFQDEMSSFLKKNFKWSKILLNNGSKLSIEVYDMIEMHTWICTQRNQSSKLSHVGRNTFSSCGGSKFNFQKDLEGVWLCWIKAKNRACPFQNVAAFAPPLNHISLWEIHHHLPLPRLKPLNIAHISADL